MFGTLKTIFGIGSKANFGELILNGAVIIDVRTKGEYQDGHLKNSINIPLDKLPGSLDKLNKKNPIITCCASGMRSSSAKSILKSNGFTEVYNGRSWISLSGFEK